MNEVGTILKRRRRALQMTMKQVADASGLSQGFVSRVEAGKFDPLTFSFVTVLALCRALKISSDFLIDQIIPPEKRI